MPKTIVIIQGHPDPAGNHLCHALADAYADGARQAGHEVRRIEVGTLDFPLLRTQADFEHGTVPESLAGARDAVTAASHIVIVFPLWLGDMPALLKGFLEQLMRPGFAFSYQAKGFPKKGLTGRSARVIMTMGMPALAYRLYFFSHSLRSLKRNILQFVGLDPVQDTLFGSVGNADPASVATWLEQARDLGAKGI
jgi:putative NADPH-quinone reductase